MRRFVSLLPVAPRLLLAACMLSIASAASATTINFNNLSKTGFPPFTSDSQGGYTVKTATGAFFVGDNFGDPVPDIFTTSTSASVDVTKSNGGDFTFSGVDLANYTAAPGFYTIAGLLDGVQEFSNSGTIIGVQAFAAYGSAYSSDVIDSLDITLTSPTQDESDLDNIVVNAAASPVPEPSGLWLLGSGLIGLTGVARRRLAAR